MTVMNAKEEQTGPAGDQRSQRRWSASKKMDAVLRLLRDRGRDATLRLQHQHASCGGRPPGHPARSRRRSASRSVLEFEGDEKVDLVVRDRVVLDAHALFFDPR